MKSNVSLHDVEEACSITREENTVWILKRQMVSVDSSQFPTGAHWIRQQQMLPELVFCRVVGIRSCPLYTGISDGKKKDCFPKVLLSVPKCVRIVARVGTEVIW